VLCYSLRVFSYAKAHKIKKKQDQFCNNVLSGKWNAGSHYPEEMQWEALVDVLRGRVKVMINRLMISLC